MKTRRSAIIKTLVMFAGVLVGRRIQGQAVEHKDLVLTDSIGTLSNIGLISQSTHLRLDLVDDKTKSGLDGIEVSYLGKTLRLTAQEIWEALHEVEGTHAQ